MRADNSRHLIAAAQQRAKQTRTRALRALRRLDDTGTAVTFEAVAREAGVSRSWLYSQAALRAEIQALRVRTRPSSSAQLTPRRQAATARAAAGCLPRPDAPVRARPPAGVGGPRRWRPAAAGSVALRTTAGCGRGVLGSRLVGRLGCRAMIGRRRPRGRRPRR